MNYDQRPEGDGVIGQLAQTFYHLFLITFIGRLVHMLLFIFFLAMFRFVGPVILFCFPCIRQENLYAFVGNAAWAVLFAPLFIAVLGYMIFFVCFMLDVFAIDGEPYFMPIYTSIVEPMFVYVLSGGKKWA